MNEGNDLSHLGFTELVETQRPQKEGHYAVEDKLVNNTQTWKLVKIEEPIIDIITIRQTRELLIELYMFTGTGGTFAGTPTINTTYYTENQVIQ